jgi:major vault protein
LFSLATLRAQAAKIEADVELFRLIQARELDLAYSKSTSDLEIDRAKRLANIETEEFKQHVNSIGAKTIQAIATSGSDNQVRFYIELFFGFI